MNLEHPLPRFSRSVRYGCWVLLPLLNACAADHTVGALEQSLEVPECRGMPEDLEVPFTLTEENIPLHWSLQECIRVTYAAAAEPLSEALELAVASFQAVECMQLCLGEPELDDSTLQLDTARGRIHLTLRAPSAELPALAHVSFDEQSGVILNARVDTLLVPGEPPPTDATRSAFGSEVDQVELVRVLQHQLGHALGLEHSEQRASVMFATVSAPVEATELVDVDVQALCTLYGEPPYCE